MTLPSVSRLGWERALYEESFYDFVRGMWDVVCGDPPVWNWHIEYLCKELQVMAEREFRHEPKMYDLIINVPPGTSKSTIASIMFPAWILARKPHKRIICGSYAFALALDLSRRCRSVLRSSRFLRLWPTLKMVDDQDAKGHFATTYRGGRLAVGSGGSVTGFHAHFIIVDDPLDPAGAYSEADVTTTNRWMRETLPSRKTNPLLTPTILIQQRLSQNDPTGEWMERAQEGEVRLICLPAEESDRISPRRLKKRYVNGLLDPVRLNPRTLGNYRRTLGEYGYACQYEQSPIPRGGGMFRVEMVEVGTAPADMGQTVRYWDKAGTKAGGAWTVGVKMGRDIIHGRIWILDVVRGQWDAAEREKIIRQTAIADGRDVWVGVEQEPGSGGKESAQNTVRNLAGWTVRVDRPTGDKTSRADPLATQWNAGVVYLQNGNWVREYLEEFQHFPNSRYKDQVDASSGAFSILTQTVVVGGF